MNEFEEALGKAIIEAAENQHENRDKREAEPQPGLGRVDTHSDADVEKLIEGFPNLKVVKREAEPSLGEIIAHGSSLGEAKQRAQELIDEKYGVGTHEVYFR